MQCSWSQNFVSPFNNGNPANTCEILLFVRIRGRFATGMAKCVYVYIHILTTKTNVNISRIRCKLQEFEGRLNFVLTDTHLKQIIICTWIIKVQDLQLNAAHFHEFILALDLCFLDYIMVTVSPAVELQVVIFDMEDAESIWLVLIIILSCRLPTIG